MGDMDLSLNWLLSIAFWTAGLVMVVVDLSTGVTLGQLGLWCSMLGGVLSIRGYLLQLHERERNAFHLGRDSTGIRGLR